VRTKSILPAALRGRTKGMIVGVGASVAAVMAMIVPAGAPAFASSGQVIVQGVATNTDGFTPMANATIYLYADPNASWYNTARPGDVVPRDLIGTGTTDSQGRFSISTSAWSALASDADSTGIVNLAVEAWPIVGPSGLSARFPFSRQLITVNGSPALAVDPFAEDTTQRDLTPQQVNLTMIPTSTVPQPPTCGQEVWKKNIGKRAVFTLVAAAGVTVLCLFLAGVL